MEYQDERPERIWVHPKHKVILQKLSELINDKSIKVTGYPIPQGMPLSSEIAAEMLNKLILDNPNFLSIKKIENETVFNANISIELKNPFILLVSNNKDELSNKDKEYLKFQLQKIKGIKKNEVYI